MERSTALFEFQIGQLLEQRNEKQASHRHFMPFDFIEFIKK